MTVHVVLVYQRSQARLRLQETHADIRSALRRREELERAPEHTGMEVVQLSADSLDTIRETHSRYFYTTAELIQRLRQALDEVSHVSSGQ